ncbi:hypothetical protein BM526_08785 [Alteromonas mediterranea]|nr:hypothetical protein BM526_08785 [Alteromonas mediterranea]
MWCIYDLNKTKNQIKLYGFFHIFYWKSDLVHFHLNLQVAKTLLRGENTWANIRNEVTQPMC